MPAVDAVALGQHSGVHQCSEHASACDLVETESRLRSRQRQRQCRVLEIVGLDSHNQVFNSVTCRGHCVILSEIVKRQSASRMLDKASSAWEQGSRHNERAVSHVAKHRDPHGVSGECQTWKATVTGFTWQQKCCSQQRSIWPGVDFETSKTDYLTISP